MSDPSFVEKKSKLRMDGLCVDGYIIVKRIQKGARFLSLLLLLPLDCVANQQGLGDDGETK
jgi:hypothetical protein